MTLIFCLSMIHNRICNISINKWYYFYIVCKIYLIIKNNREFDSYIKKVGCIKPAFFMSIFSFLYVLVCNSVI